MMPLHTSSHVSHYTHHTHTLLRRVFMYVGTYGTCLYRSVISMKKRADRRRLMR